MKREIWIMHTDDEMPLKMRLPTSEMVFDGSDNPLVKDIEELIMPMMQNLTSGKTKVSRMPTRRLRVYPCPESGTVKEVVGIFYNRENDDDWTTPLNVGYGGIATKLHKGIIPTTMIPRGRVIIVTDSDGSEEDAEVDEWKPHFTKSAKWADMHLICKGTYPFLIDQGIDVTAMLGIYGKSIAGINISHKDVDELAQKLNPEDMILAMEQLRDMLATAVLEEEEE